jgi:hypothetical protein
MLCSAERPACIEVETAPAPLLFSIPQPGAQGRRYLCDDSGAVYEPTTPQEDGFAHLTPASALRARLATGLRHQQAAEDANQAEGKLHNMGPVHACELDGEGDEGTAMPANEDHVFFSRGTMASDDALLSRGTVLSDSSCDTDLSVKETPRAVENQTWSHRPEQFGGGGSNASPRKILALANIGEGLGSDDWEEWEMQAFKEQQEQIARDCRLLADLEAQREQMQKQRQEQMAMARLLQEVTSQTAKSARMSGALDRSLDAGSKRPQEEDEVIVVRENFGPGVHVSIHSLCNHAELNGQSAVVLGWMAERIKLDLGDGRHLALKPQNLRVNIQCSSSSHASIDVCERPMSAPLKGSCKKQRSGKLLGSKKLHKLFSSNKVSVLPFVLPESRSPSSSEQAGKHRLNTRAWGE